jgi:hypothetical protein
MGKTGLCGHIRGVVGGCRRGWSGVERGGWTNGANYWLRGWLVNELEGGRRLLRGDLPGGLAVLLHLSQHLEVPVDGALQALLRVPDAYGDVVSKRNRGLRVVGSWQERSGS